MNSEGREDGKMNSENEDRRPKKEFKKDHNC